MSAHLDRTGSEIADVRDYFLAKGDGDLFAQIYDIHHGPSWFLEGMVRHHYPISQIWAIASGREQAMRRDS